MTRNVTRWEFPPSRFLSFDSGDESWARYLGYGKEVSRQQTITVPNAILTEVSDGTYKFAALPQDGSMFEHFYHPLR